MSADERLALIRVKIERAKKHIDDMNREIDAYLTSKPYVISSNEYSNPAFKRPYRVYYLQGVRPVPDLIRAIIGDVLFNVRAALDHLAYNLVAVRGFVDDKGIALTDQGIRDIGFPILDMNTAEEYEASETRKRKVRGMSQVAREAIDHTKPYKAGNEALWRLHKLNNIDKHRLVITAASALHSVDISPHLQHFFDTVQRGYFVFPNAFITPEDRVCPAEEGQIVYVDHVNPKVQDKIEVRFQVVLYEPGIVKCEPIFVTLQYMIDLVEDIILSSGHCLREVSFIARTSRVLSQTIGVLGQRRL
ncbi:MAG: hypothetical protein V7638_1376 [Acidobacteriota bacterium]|jgi:hypothetical protein